MSRPANAMNAALIVADQSVTARWGDTFTTILSQSLWLGQAIHTDRVVQSK